MDKKREARLAKYCLKRLKELGLELVRDPRRKQGRRWKLSSLLRVALVSLMAGCRSLADVEAFTVSASAQMRRRLGIAGRTPDTTLRDILCRLYPSQLRGVLHRAVKAALKRKALSPLHGLPFGVVAMDGKVTELPTSSGRYVQKKKTDNGERGLLRTFTSCLVSAAARPCIDVLSVRRSTNEMGAFPEALGGLLRAYPKRGRPFKMLSYDAGTCSLQNAGLIVSSGLHYLFALNAAQPTLFAEAKRQLGRLTQPVAIDEEHRSGSQIERRLFITDEMSGWLDWTHLRAVLRVQSVRVQEDGTETVLDDRYFISSLPAGKLKNTLWLFLVRAHWGVENNCHHTFDTVFAEDARPWINGDGQGALNVLILRRVAYTLLTLFRTVTQKSEEHRLMPWRTLVRAVYSFSMRLELLPMETGRRSAATP